MEKLLKFCKLLKCIFLNENDSTLIKKITVFCSFDPDLQLVSVGQGQLYEGLRQFFMSVSKCVKVIEIGANSINIHHSKKMTLFQKWAVFCWINLSLSRKE